MHSLTVHDPTYGRLSVHHNGDWSGEATIYFHDVKRPEVTGKRGLFPGWKDKDPPSLVLPTSLLQGLAGLAATQSLKTRLIAFLEDQEPVLSPRPTAPPSDPPPRPPAGLDPVVARVIAACPLPYTVHDLWEAVGHVAEDIHADVRLVGAATFSHAREAGWEFSEERWVRACILSHRRVQDINLDSHVEEGEVRSSDRIEAAVFCLLSRRDGGRTRELLGLKDVHLLVKEISQIAGAGGWPANWATQGDPTTTVRSRRRE